jgi:hypothetical protein
LFNKVINLLISKEQGIFLRRRMVWLMDTNVLKAPFIFILKAEVVSRRRRKQIPLKTVILTLTACELHISRREIRHQLNNYHLFNVILILWISIILKTWLNMSNFALGLYHVEEFCLMGYNVMQSVENKPACLINMSSPSSGSKKNQAKTSMKQVASRPLSVPPERRLIFIGLHGAVSQKAELSKPPLREPQFLYHVDCLYSASSS